MAAPKQPDLIEQLQALYQQHGGMYTLAGQQRPDPPQKNAEGEYVFTQSQIADPLFYSVYANEIKRALNERHTPRIVMGE